MNHPEQSARYRKPVHAMKPLRLSIAQVMCRRLPPIAVLSATYINAVLRLAGSGGGVRDRSALGASTTPAGRRAIGGVVLCFSPWAYAVAQVGASKGLDENLGWIQRPNLSNLTGFYALLNGPPESLLHMKLCRECVRRLGPTVSAGIEWRPTWNLSAVCALGSHTGDRRRSISRDALSSTSGM